MKFPEAMTAPMHLQKNKDSQLPLRRKKGLYGLKQAPRLWNEAVGRTLQRLKLSRCKSDPCLYVRVEQDVKGTVSFAIYVDDLILTSNSDELLELIKQKLMANFKMTDLCDLSWCLAIQVTQGTDAVLLSQSIHVTKLLERFGIQDCKPIKTPTAINFKKELYSVGDLLDESDKQLYQSLVGSLM